MADLRVDRPGVYKIIAQKGNDVRIQVGATKRTIEQRCKEHLRNLRSENGRENRLMRKLYKEGYKFTWEPLQNFENVNNNLQRGEQYWINRLNPDLNVQKRSVKHCKWS